MKKRVFIVGVGTFAILNLLMLSFTPIMSQAAVVWSDNFDDLDFDGWTTDDPDNFTCSNGYLESVYYNNSISHESNVNLGTWSFDFYVVDDNPDIVYFTGMDFGFWSDDNMGWRIDFRHWIITCYRFEAWPADVRGTWTSPVSLAETWTHMDITIQHPFVVDVYVNGTHAIHTEYAFASNPVTNSVTVGFGTIGEGIDNVTVSDTTDVECTNATCELDHYEPTTTTTTPTETTNDTTTPPPAAIPMELLALGIGVPVVIIVLVIGLRARRT